MNDPPYTPRPLPTEAVALPPDLTRLLERLAENAHDHWAARRISEGWVWGPQRDDSKKTHPDLIAYDRLNEAEKAYDRTTVLETLKAMIALGYRIEREHPAD